MANPTIGATTPRIQYTATASQTVFTVPFEFLANADLAVYVNGTLKTLTTDYTLTGANTTGGGTLTFVTGRTAGDIVTILGNLAYSRNTNKYTKYGLLPAEVLEADFDALQVQAKQLALADQFAIRAPLTDTGTPTMLLPDKTTRANKAIGFDATGNVALSSNTLSAIDAATTAINTIAGATAGSSASISHIASGTGATATTVQAKLREVISVKDFGAVGDGVADDTTPINQAVSASAGKILYFPKGSYKTGYQSLQSDTMLVMDPGVTLTQKAGATSIFWLQDINDTHIYANGAIFEGSATGAYHVVTFTGAKRCSINNANITGAGVNMDGIYVGQGASGDPSEDVIIFGGSVANAKRNGISVVAGLRTIIDGVEIYGTTGSPGSGIDVEANNYDRVSDTLIQNCICRNNARSGIINSFGYRTTLRRNVCYSNGDYGIVSTIGGVSFDDAVARSNVDIRGVSAFDTVTGRISVGGDLETLPVGMNVYFSTRNGATLPGGLSGNINTVCAHVSGSTTDIKVGLVFDTQVVNSFSSAATGTLNADPALSDIRMTCYGVAGQSSALTVNENICYSNGLDGIRVTTSRDVRIVENKVYNNSRRQLYCDYTSNVVIDKNTAYQETQTNYAGILVYYCAFSQVTQNYVYETGGVGIDFIACGYSVLSGNVVYNCGRLASSTLNSLFYLQDLSRSRIENNTGYSSEDYTGTYGMYTSAVANSQFIGNVLKNGGSSNANSFVLSGTTNYTLRNIQYDGTTWGVFTATYDPPNLVDGDGVTTNVTVSNATLGDFVRVSFSLALQGILLTGWVTSSTNVAVRFQNETGGTIDLGSGTIRVMLEKP